ncbi:MAG: hypothetical protein HQL62_05050 [Magnetococcales bacterium]|nr:hypothetical protein [Magnetococcales bacterium]
MNQDQTSALEVLWLDAVQVRQLTLYPHIPDALARWLEGISPDTPYLGRVDQPWAT